ncbi:endonuclease/exonuclease/phosphatase family protein [Kordia periserrulae]|uniref:Endonuclease/exonuclease/phosphatase family protein n=1 Tax=Kordia periserrulae TaxID=701523 RepID=A0A2T6BX02_9FLAO|nr:endonuclease/exonuclease/phosphatase family protein [Kordia periserrulae]
MCIAILIHFTIKDTFYLSSLLFYTTPLPLIALGLLFLLLFVKASARKYYVIAAVVIGGIWFTRSYTFSAKVATENATEVVLWNGYRRANFEDAFAESNSIPDVLVMIEADEKNYQKIRENYPNYHFELTEKAIGIFSKTPVQIHSNIKTEQHVVVVHFSTKNTNFYAIDVSADLRFFRKNMLQSVLSEIKTSEKNIILGDFNTPFESIFFENFKKNYQHAFAEKGNGFRETWFWNIPLLSLDHIWVSNDLEILKTEKISTWKSDHSMLKMYLKNESVKK